MADRTPTLQQDIQGTDILGRPPEFGNDRIYGDEGVAYVQQVLAASHQVKNDLKGRETHRVFLEYMDDPGATGERWRPSGWQKCDAQVWTQLVGHVVVSAPTWLVQHVGQLLYHKYPEYRRTMYRGSCHAAGLVVPIGVFVAYCVEESAKVLGHGGAPSL